MYHACFFTHAKFLRANEKKWEQKWTQNTQALSGSKESDKLYIDYSRWISQMETPSPLLTTNQNSLTPKCEEANGFENLREFLNELRICWGQRFSGFILRVIKEFLCGRDITSVLFYGHRCSELRRSSCSSASAVQLWISRSLFCGSNKEEEVFGISGMQQWHSSLDEIQREENSLSSTVPILPFTRLLNHHKTNRKFIVKIHSICFIW